MQYRSQQKFYSILEELYIGATFNGKGGLAKLLQFKGEYFKAIKEQILRDIEDCKFDNHEELYAKLYTFFSSYLSDGGSVFFTDTPVYKNVYTKISLGKSDTALFYKTQDLLYVKSQKNWQTINDLKFDYIPENSNKKYPNVTFNFIADYYQFSKNNAKPAKELFLLAISTEPNTDDNLTIVDDDNIKLVIYVLDSQSNAITKNLSKEDNIRHLAEYKRICQFIDETGTTIYGFVADTDSDYKEIVQYFNEHNIAIELAHIKKAISNYTRQAQVDYFIHKNAKSFLQEQYRIFIFNYLTDESVYKQERLDNLKKYQKIAFNVIAHIANFEDELKKIYEKPKFVLGTNYVISLDKLSVDILQNIINHAGFKQQFTEWQQLGQNCKYLEFINTYKDIEQFTKDLLAVHKYYKEVANDGTNTEDNILSLSLPQHIKLQDAEKYKYLTIDTVYFTDIKSKILSNLTVKTIIDGIGLDDIIDGLLIKSENYQAMNTLLTKYKESVQCIYIDPPFNTGSDFDYKDGYQDSTWCTIMHDRLKLAREFLRDDGSIYVHLDYNASQFGKILLNNIYGTENCLNEIVWCYTGGTDRLKGFQQKHDNIFLYNKSGAMTFNPIYVSFAESSINRFNKIDDMGRKFKENTLKNGSVTKTYMKEEGKIAPDYWEISIVNSTYDESQDFKTQKPEKLLQRAISASSNPSMLVMDFFAGSGTTLATAHKLGRKWIGIEMGEHFDTVILPRMKKVLCGVENGISQELKQADKLTKGGVFKYYELEQYEDTLSRACYENLANNLDNLANISFENNEKLAKDGLEIGQEEIIYRFEKLYPDVDIFECLSNVMGWKIYQIKSDDEVEYLTESNTKKSVKKADITFANYPNLKSLIWW